MAQSPTNTFDVIEENATIHHKCFDMDTSLQPDRGYFTESGILYWIGDTLPNRRASWRR